MLVIVESTSVSSIYTDEMCHIHPFEGEMHPLRRDTHVMLWVETFCVLSSSAGTGE